MKESLLFLINFYLMLPLYVEKERVIHLQEERIEWREEDENYLFYNPSSLKIDEMGNIYVVDRNNHRVQVFSSNGKWKMTIGKKGEGPSSFLYPSDIFLTNNLLYITDSNNRIQIFDRRGSFRKQIKLNFRPWEILVNKRGEIYVTKLVDVFDPSKEFLIKILSPEGELLGEFHQAIKFSEKMKDFKRYLKSPERVVTDLLNWVKVGIDSEDNIIVAHKGLINRIAKYNSKGKLILEFETILNAKGPFRKIGNYDLIGFVQSISIGRGNEIYLLSPKFMEDEKDFGPGGNKIYKYDPSGKYLETLVLPFDAKIISVDKGENIFAIDMEDRIRKCKIAKKP